MAIEALTVPSYAERMAISSAQFRAARAWLDWTRKALADKAGVGLETVQAIERGYSDPRKSTLDKLERAFREAGIVFIDEGDAGGPGIRKIS
jgi:predicted transcriptional regulator